MINCYHITPGTEIFDELNNVIYEVIDRPFEDYFCKVLEFNEEIEDFYDNGTRQFLTAQEVKNIVNAKYLNYEA